MKRSKEAQESEGKRQEYVGFAGLRCESASWLEGSSESGFLEAHKFGQGLQDQRGGTPEAPSGEEEELVVLQSRVKLFRFSRQEGGRWLELGTGIIRVNAPIDKANSSLPRLIMRREGVLKLLLNGFIRSREKFEVCDNTSVRFTLESHTDEFKGLGLFTAKFSRRDDVSAFIAAIEKVKVDLTEKVSTDDEKNGPAGDGLSKPKGDPLDDHSA